MSHNEVHTLEIVGFVVVVLLIMGTVTLCGVLFARRARRREAARAAEAAEREPPVPTQVLTSSAAPAEPTGPTGSAESTGSAVASPVSASAEPDLDRAAGEAEPDHATEQSVASAESLLGEMGLGEEIPLLEGKAAGPAPGDPAAWHPDPDGRPGTIRYWDGRDWTEHYAEKAP